MQFRSNLYLCTETEGGVAKFWKSIKLLVTYTRLITKFGGNSLYSFWKRDVHTDIRTDGQTGYITVSHTPLLLCLFLLLKLSSFPDFVRESNADMYFLCHFQLVSKPRLGSDADAGEGGGGGRARAETAQSLIMCTIFRSSIMVNNLLLLLLVVETGNRKRLFLNNKIKFCQKKKKEKK